MRDFNTVALRELADIRQFLTDLMRKKTETIAEFRSRTSGPDLNSIGRALSMAPVTTVDLCICQMAENMYEKISTPTAATPASVLNYCLQECHPDTGHQSTSSANDLERAAKLEFHITVAKFITSNGSV